MSPSELEEILYRDPFQPFRVTLASGDQLIVNNARRAMISGLSLVIGVNEDPNARVGTRLKLVSIPNIVLAESIDSRPTNGRRRRK